MSKLDSDLALFKVKRNAINNLMNKARQAFYTKLIEDNSCNQRKLFRASKSLFNQSQGDELPPNLHAPTFASEVGKYFVSKIDTIQRQIDADIIDLPASAFTTADGFNRSTPSLSAFKILSANSVKSLIHNSTLSYSPYLTKFRQHFFFFFVRVTFLTALRFPNSVLLPGLAISS